MVDRTRGGYASETMAQRRARILAAARMLLGEGEAKLTIARLCEEAGVAPRTIYRAFGDRDGVIHAAIGEHMRSIREFLAVTPLRGDIASVFREYDWIAAELLRGAGFARVIIGFYFSPGAHRSDLAALRSVARMRIDAWLDHAAATRQLVTGLDRERLARNQVDTEYVVFNRWAAGEIGDAVVGDELKANFLMTAIVATRDEGRPELTRRLTEFHRRLDRFASDRPAANDPQ